MKNTDLRDLFANGVFKEKSLSQVLALAGEGKLLDDSMASDQFRRYLQAVTRSTLVHHANECLQKDFDNAPQALQDIVNEIGRRLGLKIKYGRYRGKKGEPGHDGLWIGSNGSTFVVEVKTTDVYRINLGLIDGYRKELVEGGEFNNEQSYILIVVGRQDTGDLEAQIRGSKQAWNARVISISALFRLLELQEILDLLTVDVVTRFLEPTEFTRLDGLLDLIIWLARDAHEDKPILPETIEQDSTRIRDQALTLLGNKTKQPIVRKSRTLAEIPALGGILFISYSKIYRRGAEPYYWYKYASYHDRLLSAAPKAFLAFVLETSDKILVIPYKDFAEWLPSIHTRPPKPKIGEDFYWHIQFFLHGDKLLLPTKKKGVRPDLSKYTNRYDLIC